MTLWQLCSEARPEVLAQFIRTTRRAVARNGTPGVTEAHQIAVLVYRARGLSPIRA